MLQENPPHSEPPPQVNPIDVQQHPTSFETGRPPVTLENAILEPTSEVEQAPSWFGRTVKTITDAWFDPKSFESQKVYEDSGVKLVKKYMPISGNLAARLVWKKLGSEPWAKQGDIRSLKRMELFTRIFETTHLVSFGLGMALASEQFANHNLAGGMAYTVINSFMNVYPIMLQRYNRIRLYRAINRMEGRNSRAIQHVPTTQVAKER